MIVGINNFNDYNLKNEDYSLIRNTDFKEEKLSAAEIKAKKRSGEMDCEKCSSRKYVDGSDDAGVSFKTPQHISPSQSAATVMSHEREHYNRETTSAETENKEIVSATISLTRSICSECGRSYVSGGQTSITKRVDTDKNAEKNYFNNKFYINTVGKHMSDKIDMSI